MSLQQGFPQKKIVWNFLLEKNGKENLFVKNVVIKIIVKGRLHIRVVAPDAKPMNQQLRILLFTDVKCLLMWLS